jgi:threonine dehydrogenase-like Zn-dependent dehydrogenase
LHALTFAGTRRIAHETVDDPAIEHPGDAIVRVELCGICGSDLHVYHGRETGLDRGTVMGHEFVGEVVEVGGDVRSFAPGSRVLSPFTTSCGRCAACASGLTSRCTRGQLFGWVEEGSGLHGAQAEYVRVPLADGTLVAVPDGVGPVAALLLGDVLTTGYFAARGADVRPDGVYVVLGCGPVGLGAVIGARELGAGTVIAVDSVPERLRLAERFGAIALDRGAADVGAALAEHTEGRGADAVMEVVGSAEAHRTAIELVRPGGTISVVGVHSGDAFGFRPADAYDKNLTYRVGRCPARHLLGELVPWVREGRYDLDAIVSHRLPLSGGVDGYRIFDEKLDGCTKVVLAPGGAG